MNFRNVLKQVLPHGLVDGRVKRRRMQSLSIDWNGRLTDFDSAVSTSRFDLWPLSLRETKVPWTLVDIGANRGQFLAAACLLSCPQDILVFEPLRELMADLKELSETIPGVQVFSVALGACQGRISINRTQDPSFSSILQPRRDVTDGYGVGSGQIVEQLDVPLTTLDAVVERAEVTEVVGLLKLDVQGVETDVLRGAFDTLQRTEVVLVEANYVDHYESASGFAEIYSMLAELGFCLCGMSSPVMIKGVAQWADAVFRRKDSLL